MKTTFKTLLISISLLCGSIFTHAQDYKHPKPGSISNDGQVRSADGKLLGWVTQDGLIKDSSGLKIGQIDSDGNLVDSKTGKKIGKAQKNGNYLPYFKKDKSTGYITSLPANGTCEVKNEKGETLVLVHENYKQYGACAYHCLSMKRDHKYMKMK